MNSIELLSIGQLRELGKTLFLTRRGLLTLEQVQEWLELGPVIRMFDTWAVTEHGVECMVEYYPIEVRRLSDPLWVQQLSAKSWMTAAMLQDFIHALDFAKDHFGLTPKRGKLDLATRFAVLKRDDYRCQICGRGAHDGVTLEIDHKIPVAKGGTNRRNNLHTLCFDCNRGKRDNDL